MRLLIGFVCAVRTFSVIRDLEHPFGRLVALPNCTDGRCEKYNFWCLVRTGLSFGRIQEKLILGVGAFAHVDTRLLLAR